MGVIGFVLRETVRGDGITGRHFWGGLVSGTIQQMTEETGRIIPIEERYIQISVKVAFAAAVFALSVVGAAAAWAQNVSNHMQNLDSTLIEMKTTLQKVQELSVLQDRATQDENRIQRLENHFFRDDQTRR